MPPKVVIVPTCVIAIHMGSDDYDGFYDANANIIYVDYHCKNTFTTILHEAIHWIICLLPRIDLVWELNILYDDLWDYLA